MAQNSLADTVCKVAWQAQDQPKDPFNKLSKLTDSKGSHHERFMDFLKSIPVPAILNSPYQYTGLNQGIANFKAMNPVSILRLSSLSPLLSQNS